MDNVYGFDWTVFLVGVGMIVAAMAIATLVVKALERHFGIIEDALGNFVGMHCHESDDKKLDDGGMLVQASSNPIDFTAVSPNVRTDSVTVAGNTIPVMVKVPNDGPDLAPLYRRMSFLEDALESLRKSYVEQTDVFDDDITEIKFSAEISKEFGAELSNRIDRVSAKVSQLAGRVTKAEKPRGSKK